MEEMAPHCECVQSDEYSFSDVAGLTRALRQGEDSAYRWLYAKWGFRIQCYAFAVAEGDAALSADAAQAAWIRLARHIRVLSDEQALWNWIALAVRHATVDLRRSGARYRRALERFADFFRSAEVIPYGDGENILLGALRSVIARLSSQERDLLDLRYFERQSICKIAERMGVSERAVEGRLSRLRRRIRSDIIDEVRNEIQ